MRREHARDRDRRADRFQQVAAAQPHFALAHQVDRHDGEVDLQGLDGDRAQPLAQRGHQAFAADQRTVERRVEVAQHPRAGEAAQPVAQFRKLPGGLEAAHQRTAGRAGDGGDAQAARLHRLDHADLREAPRATGAQHQRDGLVADWASRTIARVVAQRELQSVRACSRSAAGSTISASLP